MKNNSVCCKSISAALIIAVCCTSALAAPIHTVVSFEAEGGNRPSTGLSIGPDGYFYGTTENGMLNTGTLFRLHPAAEAVETLVRFDGFNGGDPHLSAPIFDDAGRVYGTTGVNKTSYGTVFRYDPGTGMLTTLMHFNRHGSNGMPSNGVNPYGGLAFDGSGRLIVSESGVGSGFFGSLVRLEPETGFYETVARFTSRPHDRLVRGSDGKIYGTTFGSIDIHGTVYRYDPVAMDIETLFQFDGVHGTSPEGGVVFDAGGNIYGVTRRGGAVNDGTVYRLDPSSAALQTLVTFFGPNGAQPMGGLVFGSDGYLYGTTASGGQFDKGTVFRLHPGTSHFETLASFNTSNGEMPVGHLIVGPDGQLFGMTSHGGANGMGTIYRIAVPEAVDWRIALAVVFGGTRSPFLSRRLLTRALRGQC